jgi:hypothetical protein
MMGVRDADNKRQLRNAYLSIVTVRLLTVITFRES